MKVAIMQPYLFPYIGYWQLINAVDIFVIFDDVNFIKKGYINRNTILVGEAGHQFTLELIKASQNKLINEIEVGGNKEKLLKTVEMAYKRSPYFKVVFPVLEDIFSQKENNLARFIGCSLEKISNYLEMDVKFIYSSSIEKNNSLKGQEKIIDIVKILNGTEYVNAAGGKELYNKEVFNREKVRLNFIETEAIEYKQFENEFVPYLSIIDVMMFNGIDEIKKMLSRYTLV